MPEFVVSFIHVDELDEGRCICRVIWDLPNKKEVYKRASAIIKQVVLDAEDDFDLDIDKNDVEIRVTTLDEFLLGFRQRGIEKLRLFEDVQKYAFVQEGATVIWNDPDDGLCSGPKVVKSCTCYRDEDSTVLLVNPDGTGETEAYYSELDPYKET